MAKRIGTLYIWYSDDRDDVYNESVSIDLPYYVEEEDDGMNIEFIYESIRRFCAAFGFAEATIREWFP